MGKPITQDEIAAIYLRQQQKLFLTALSYTDSMYAAEEIVGDTIVAALEAKVTFDNEAACACYMRAVVRNKAISCLSLDLLHASFFLRVCDLRLTRHLLKNKTRQQSFSLFLFSQHHLFLIIFQILLLHPFVT